MKKRKQINWLGNYAVTIIQDNSNIDKYIDRFPKPNMDEVKRIIAEIHHGHKRKR